MPVQLSMVIGSAYLSKSTSRSLFRSCFPLICKALTPYLYMRCCRNLCGLIEGIEDHEVILEQRELLFYICLGCGLGQDWSIQSRCSWLDWTILLWGSNDICIKMMIGFNIERCHLCSLLMYFQKTLFLLMADFKDQPTLTQRSLQMISGTFGGPLAYCQSEITHMFCPWT